jgi:hypothetical protein
MNAGHVYVIAFDNGMVKVGQTQNLPARFDAHERSARSFGLKLTGRWESPLHDDWLENEQALMRIARELGGQPTTPEYFSGVSFDALAARAQELNFPPPLTEPEDAARSHREGGVPGWLKDDIARSCRLIACGGREPGEVLQILTDQVLRDRDFVRLLVERHVRKGLKAALKCESADDMSALEVPMPEPPEPEPPQATGPVPFYGNVRSLPTEMFKADDGAGDEDDDEQLQRTG